MARKVKAVVKQAVPVAGPALAPEQAPAPTPPAVKMLKVRSTDGHPFWEVHPDHPGGEVWVAGSQVAEVALTASVHSALRNERLVRV